MPLYKEKWEKALRLDKTDKEVFSREGIKKTLGVSENDARGIHFALRNESIIRFLRGNDSFQDEKEVLIEDSGNERTIFVRSHQIRTLDELLKYSNVDMNEWKVSKHTVNKWGSEKNANFQVKAWLEKRVNDFSPEELMIEFQEKLDSHVVPKEYPKIKVEKDGLLLEVSIPDFHFGQLSWGRETGDSNYDLKIASKLFLQAVNYFCQNAKQFKIKKILFPVGSDFFNINSKLNQTVLGTTQDEDCRWQKSFDQGLNLVIAAIDILQNIAPVDVLVVPGNHDEERIYYMGATLEAWYRNCKHVNVDNSPTIRKYYLFGENLLGFTHSDKEKKTKNSLPMIMASERKEWWGQTKFREFHIGHKHHADITQTKLVKEDDGVKTIMIPSLAPLDAWHSGKGYSHVKEAISSVYHENKGCISRLYYHP